MSYDDAGCALLLTLQRLLMWRVFVFFLRLESVRNVVYTFVLRVVLCLEQTGRDLLMV